MKLSSIVMILFLLLSSCERQDSRSQKPFRESLDALVMNYTSLEKVANYTKIPKSDLLKMYWGETKSYPQVDEVLNDLVVSFENDYLETEDRILHDVNSIELTALPSKERGITVNDVIRNEKKLHPHFQSAVNSILVNEIDTHITNVIEETFSILHYPKLIWAYLTQSKAAITADLNEKLVQTFKRKRIEQRIQNQLVSYTEFLNTQRTYVNYSRKIRMREFDLTNDQINVSERLQDPLLHRLNNEIYSTTIEICELLIGAILLIVTNRVVSKKLKKIQDEHAAVAFLGKKVKNKWLRGIALIGNQIAATYRENEQVKKYKRLRSTVDVCSMIILMVLGYYMYDSKNSFLESEMRNSISENFADYLSKQNTYVLDYFNRQSQI